MVEEKKKQEILNDDKHLVFGYTPNDEESILEFGSKMQLDDLVGSLITAVTSAVMDYYNYDDPSVSEQAELVRTDIIEALDSDAFWDDVNVEKAVRN